MLAMSIDQPFANLIMSRGQLIYGRNFPATLEKQPFRGEMMIHAGTIDPRALKIDKKLADTCQERVMLGTIELVDVIDKHSTTPPDDHFQALAIRVGEHFPGDFHPEDYDEFVAWWEGKYRFGWIFKNPKLFDTPLPERGRPGLWDFTPQS